MWLDLQDTKEEVSPLHPPPPPLLQLQYTVYKVLLVHQTTFLCAIFTPESCYKYGMCANLCRGTSVCIFWSRLTHSIVVLFAVVHLLLVFRHRRTVVDGHKAQADSLLLHKDSRTYLLDEPAY